VPNELRRILKFGTVGVLNTLIDLGVSNLLFLLGVNIYVATSISFLASATNSYFLNRAWTFKDHQVENSWTKYGQFVFVATTGLIINYVMIYIGTRVLNVDNELVKANIILLSRIAVSMGWNYLLTRFVVFKKQS
jgi:putative flippase GtrA